MSMSDFHYTPFNADATLCGIPRSAKPLSTGNPNATDCARCLAKLAADDELTECHMTRLHCEECGNTDLADLTGTYSACCNEIVTDPADCRGFHN